MAVASSGSVTDPAGTITGAEFHSATMGEDISYNVYLPAGYSSTATRYPVIYLLHGRGDSKSAWTQVIDHVDTTYRTIASRDGRVIGGYSMGGYGAMRYSIAHPDLFAASIVLSPAVYNPVPAQDSSARTFGAFGQGAALFVDAIYRRLDYPAELPRFSAKNLPSHMLIAVGDDEYELAPTGGAPIWIRQLGTTGENKGIAVAAGGGYAYIAGMAGDAIGTPLPGTAPGGIDGFLAQFDASGTRTWTKQVGTMAEDQLWGVTADAAGNAIISGFTAGDVFASNAGDKDIVVARFDSSGAMTLHDQLGTIGNDKGANVALDGAGNTYLSGFSDGNLETNIGSFDAVLVKYGPGLTRQWTRQFGTTETDGADAFAEGDVFLATYGTTIWASGFTMGSTATQAQAGKRRRVPHVVRRPGHEPRLTGNVGRAAPAALPEAPSAYYQGLVTCLR